eukprot:TRINITY_DN5966_c0_g1_i2.p1 TRINITY_DN5966_c0_g1~~TRINITY_DN5966_c0_g1_i2.p1  ORF type:complete len:776 (-),score=318.58 TRINITY_DN5966_c0_g1_i2:1713-3998(-)
MTSIDKLLIQGIRSFDQQKGQVIEFYKPLTIIVGQNGAGKTTIIECLKYACTGEVPPNSNKGQAFIHDPKVAGEREIKAQIKLRFKSVNGKPIVCTRSLQLTQKAKTLEMKTLESALQTYNPATGEKVSQSYRCADMDNLIPELMGVSKSILESVIFCHQEDSNWPLSEASVLKKKFDDIFASTRYTKALEAIKKEKKSQNDLLKEYGLKMETIKTNRDLSIQFKSDLKNLTEKVNQTDEEIKSLREVINQKELKITQLRKKQSGAQEEIQEVIKMKATRAQLIDQNKQTHKELANEFTESDEELKQLSDRFVDEVKQLEEKEIKVSNQIKRLEQEKNGLEKKVQEASENFGRLQTMEENLKSLVQDREKRIQSFTKRYGIRGYENAPYSVEQVSGLLEKTESMMNQLRESILETKNANQQKNQEMERKLDKSKESQAQLNERKRSTEKTIDQQKHKINLIQKELQEREKSLLRIDSATEEVAKEKQMLEDLQRKYNKEEINQQIAKLNQEKNQTEKRVIELADLVKKLSVQSSKRAKLNVLKVERSKKKDHYNHLLEARREEFERILGKLPDNLLELKPQLEKSIQKKASLLSEVRKSLEKEKGKSSELSGKLQGAQQQMKKFESEISENEKKLEKIGGSQGELPDLISKAEKNVEEKKKTITMTQSAEVMYQNFVGLAEEGHECPLCERSFAKENELKRFLAKLKEVLDTVPKSIKENSTGLKESEVLLTELKKTFSFLGHNSKTFKRTSRHSRQNLRI